MKKKIMVTLMSVLLMIGTLSFARGPHGPRGPRGFGPGGPRGKGGPGIFLKLLRNKQALKEIGITNTTINRIKKLVTSAQKRVIPIMSKIKLTRINIREAMDQETIDKSKVLSLTDKIHNLIGKIHKIRTSTRIDIINMLTVKQRTKLREMGRKRFRRHWRGHRGGRRHKSRKEGRNR